LRIKTRRFVACGKVLRGADHAQKGARQHAMQNRLQNQSKHHCDQTGEQQHMLALLTQKSGMRRCIRKQSQTFTRAIQSMHNHGLRTRSLRLTRRTCTPHAGGAGQFHGVKTISATHLVQRHRRLRTLARAQIRTRVELRLQGERRLGQIS